jgi:hypothetical protein
LIVLIFLTELQAEDLNVTLEEIKKTVGGARNYGPSPEQRAEAAAAAAKKEVCIRFLHKEMHH